MLRRITGITLEIAAAVFAGLVVLSALAFWRVSTQPVSLDFLKERVAGALSPAGEGRLEIGGMRLEWHGWGRLFEVRVTELQFANRRGDIVLSAPFADVGLDAPHLLLGRIAPVRITVERPTVELERGIDGGVRFYGAASADLSGMLSGSGGGENAGDALEQFENFLLRGATINLRDSTGRQENIRLSGFDGTLERRDDGWRVEAATRLLAGGEETGLRGEGTYFHRTGMFRGAVLFEGLAPGLLLPYLPRGGADISVDSRFSGTVAFSLASFDTLSSLDIIATATDGEISFGAVLPAPVAFDSLRFQGGFDAAAGRAVLRNLVLERDGVTAMLGGTLTGLANPVPETPAPETPGPGLPELELTATITALPMAEVETLWPPDLFQLARGWVTGNLRDGMLTRITARMKGRLDTGEWGRLRDVSVTGDMTFEGMTVDYLPPLPPARDVAGRADFTEKRIDAELTGGHLDDIRLKRADLTLTGIHTVSDDHATIEAEIEGPVRDILRVLDTEPFGYAAALGLAPEEVGGSGSGTMRFAMPLRRVMTFDLVDFDAEGRFTGLSLPARITRLPFADGDMKLALDGDGMSMEGTGTLSALPARIAFRQAFAESADPRRRTDVTIRPDMDRLAALGLDIRRFAQGEVALDATIEEPPEGDIRIDLVAGLQDIALRVPELGWEKPSGAAGTLRASLRAGGDSLRAIDSFQVATGDLAASGMMVFAPGTGAPERLEVDSFRLGETDLSAIVAADGAGGYTADIEGAFADLRALSQGAEETGTRPDIPLRLAARVDRVLVETLGPVQDVTLLLESDGAGELSLSANGAVGAEPVDILYMTDDEDSRFELGARNAGNVLRGVEGLDAISGGRLEISGDTAVRDGRDGWNVMLSVNDFDLVDAPVMAQLLSALSLTGLPAVVQGRGVHFDDMEMTMHVSDEKFVLDNLLAQGASLGISAFGEIDRLDDRSAITGMVVPAYVLNEIIGSIPILGTLLTGGKGEGFLASEFSVTGPLEKPEVSVNPLTALAPGILRNLFRFENARPQGVPPVDPLSEEDHSP